MCRVCLDVHHFLPNGERFSSAWPRTTPRGARSALPTNWCSSWACACHHAPIDDGITVFADHTPWMTDGPGEARSLAAARRHACSGIEFAGTTRCETTEKGCDRWRYGGETNGKGRPSIRGAAQDLRIERSRDLFSVQAGELYPEIAQRHDWVVRTYLSPLDGQLHETSLELASPKLGPFQDRIP